MKIVYETPNKEYQIRKQVNEEWGIVFGDEIVVFNICKYNSSLAKWNLEHPDAKLSDYVILRSEEKLEDALRWLKSNSVISGDELKNQVEKIGK